MSKKNPHIVIVGGGFAGANLTRLLQKRAKFADITLVSEESYTTFNPMLAEVVGVGHSAAAPLQRMVRCAVHVGNDVRLARVLLPPDQSPPVGHPIWLIVPPGRPQFGIPAALFE